MTTPPVRLAIIDDYEVIVLGTAAILEPHQDLVELIEVNTDGKLSQDVDVALLDCFGSAEAHAGIVAEVAAHPRVGRVAVYTWNFAPALLDAAFAAGATSYLSKGLPGTKLAKALVDTHHGERVVADGGAVGRPEVGRRWPGRDLGLTEREAEVLAHISQGRRTREIADALYLSVNSIKTHTQHLYRKIGVTSRTEAALWGIDHGFRPDRNTRDDWSG
ncbi:MAG TPA: response regulator transcription factor [Aquihabitans sp.]|nr:response regulator transcription factor [Aquihabitans sp.]